MVNKTIRVIRGKDTTTLQRKESMDKKINERMKQKRGDCITPTSLICLKKEKKKVNTCRNKRPHLSVYLKLQGGKSFAPDGSKLNSGYKRSPMR